MTLLFDDIKNNTQKCLDYLDKKLFVDSTITLSHKDYIKKSIENKLLQYVLLNERIVKLEDDPDRLKKAMLRSSLGEKDIDLILTASLKIAGAQLKILDDKELEKELDEDTAKELIEEKQKSLGSLKNLINIISENKGSSRVSFIREEEAMFYGPYCGGDFLAIEQPIKFDVFSSQLNALSEEETGQILISSLACDSNSSLTFLLPLNALTEETKVFIKETLPALCTAGAEYCANKTNTLSFTIQENPFETLFNNL